MARPQNSPKGLFQKSTQISVGANNLTANSTALILSAGVKVSNAQTVTANSTGLIFADGVSALPGSVRIATTPVLAAFSNSTGRAFALNTTGTTWLYLAGTTVQPAT